MKIYYVSAEVEPFAKSGGLGDVLGALPKAMAAKGNDVRVIMPRYKIINEKYMSQMRLVSSMEVWLGWRKQACHLYELRSDAVIYYFIDNPFYYSGDTIYDEYDLERFSFFCKAALEVLTKIDFCPDVIHCNDWTTALLPIMLNYFYKRTHFYGKIKTVFTIHNLKFQGIYDIGDVIDKTGLSGACTESKNMELDGKCNLLKGAIGICDAITTVSPTYAEEIKTVEYGEGLNDFIKLHSDKLCGILNGVDYNIYNPETDSLIFKKYNLRSHKGGKAANKMQLLKQVGLPQSKVPLLSMVTRLYDQKGLDLVLCDIDNLMREDIQLIVLGTGDKGIEGKLKYYENEYPDKMAVVTAFDNALAHNIYAASDLFIMPSKFEPCGLSQIISMKYGTLPVVRRTGGLKDTVRNFDIVTGEGNGFSFDDYNAQKLLSTIMDALNLINLDEENYKKIVKNAMCSDFSWEQSSNKYMELYKKIVE
ncbi:MAG: glycogen synthase GlgA [Clostridia bacterium]